MVVLRIFLSWNSDTLWICSLDIELKLLLKSFFISRLTWWTDAIYLYPYEWIWKNHRMQNGIRIVCNETSSTKSLIKWKLRSTISFAIPRYMLTISCIDISVNDNAKIWHSFNVMTTDLLYYITYRTRTRFSFVVCVINKFNDFCVWIYIQFTCDHNL